jgi:hypothetical protein
VFKKGEKYLANNYRPVSLTCICCKILEHIVVSNILKHLDEQNILVDCQHGFRSKQSCETQLLTLAHELADNLHNGIQTDLVIRFLENLRQGTAQKAPDENGQLQYTPSVSTIILSGWTYSSQNVRQICESTL